MNFRHIIISGCALFAMLFGAANIVLPLILGRAFGNESILPMAGFILTAVLLPVIGFVSVMLARGDQRSFLEPLGKIPGLAIGLLCMILLGPVGAIPRCIAIAHADLAFYLPDLSTWTFSIIAAAIILLCTYQRTNVVNILGRYLGPLKILCLLSIVAFGLFAFDIPHTPLINEPMQNFLHGFFEGYGTMDLLAVIFFSQLVYVGLMKNTCETKPHAILKTSLAAGTVAGLLLALVYAGFAAIAAFHGKHLNNIANDTLLSALASRILGSQLGVFANITIALTCLTTAIALTTTFAEFISRDVLNRRVSYKTALIGTVVLSAMMANLRFDGIMRAVLPWINLCYPALTVFALLHLLAKTGHLQTQHARWGFFITLGISAFTATSHLIFG